MPGRRVLVLPSRVFLCVVNQTSSIISFHIQACFRHAIIIWRLDWVEYFALDVSRTADFSVAVGKHPTECIGRQLRKHPSQALRARNSLGVGDGEGLICSGPKKKRKEKKNGSAVLGMEDEWEGDALVAAAWRVCGPLGPVHGPEFTGGGRGQNDAAPKFTVLPPLPHLDLDVDDLGP